MNCDQAKEWLVLQIEGELDHDAAANLREHLIACSSCRAEREAVSSLNRRLSFAVPARREGGTPAIAQGVMDRIAGRPAGGRTLRARALRWVGSLAAAATIVLAISLPLSTTRPAGAAPLATMTTKIRRAGSVAFRISSIAEGREWRSARFVILNQRLQRAELSDGRVVIADLNQQTALVLMPDRRWATRSQVRTASWHFYPILTGLDASLGIRIGEEVFDGQPAEIFQLPAPSGYEKGLVTVWMSRATGLPLRIRYDPSVVQTSEGPVQSPSTLMEQFVFDGEYEDSLFSLDVPEGYSLQPPIVDTAVAMNQASLNVYSLANAVAKYMHDHLRSPGSLQRLVDEGLTDAAALDNPRRPAQRPGFLYFPPKGPFVSTDDLPWGAAVVFEAFDDWPGTAIVGFFDGHTEVIDNEARYRDLLSQARMRAGLHDGE